MLLPLERPFWELGRVKLMGATLPQNQSCSIWLL